MFRFRHFIVFFICLLLQTCNAAILSFKERLSGVDVTLVGAMHYHPVSIALAKEKVESLAKVNNLASVLVESCPKRWEKMQIFQGDGTFMKYFLQNEMQAASDVASGYGVETLLGDQDIETTTKCMKDIFKVSLTDLLSPMEGWKRFYSEVKRGWDSSSGYGDEYLGWQDSFNGPLLLGTPVSLIRYISALVLKSPVFGVGLFCFIELSSYLSAIDSPFPAGEGTEKVLQVLTSVFASSVETIFVSRIFLIGLLVERNKILADNIAAACATSLAQAAATGTAPRHVVAVLGMAHCNGVKKLLVQGPKSGEQVEAT